MFVSTTPKILQRNRNISIDKIAALGFFTLLLMVSGIKAFHSHRSFSKNYEQGVSVSTAKYCSICEFHFAKDADCFIAAIESPGNAGVECVRILPTSGVPSQPLQSLCLRGPPNMRLIN